MGGGASPDRNATELFGSVARVPVLLTIGVVSSRSGAAPSALRFYESRGLIRSERSEGNQRRYRRDVLRRVAFIQVARRAGMTLEEAGAALATLPSDRAPSREEWAALAERLRPVLDEQLAALESVRHQIASPDDRVEPQGR